MNLSLFSENKSPLLWIETTQFLSIVSLICEFGFSNCLLIKNIKEINLKLVKVVNCSSYNIVPGIIIQNNWQNIIPNENVIIFLFLYLPIYHFLDQCEIVFILWKHNEI